MMLLKLYLFIIIYYYSVKVIGLAYVTESNFEIRCPRFKFFELTLDPLNIEL